ncbi:unnamed protein product [Adineta ricciae]|uniref:G-protein coupled receptors family 1 profile domain-containing protein n=1 Tax=Adineta ricciae TaxID=249248 RepID=A0A814V2L0_ADIRI|nr:unnamed protein product [Adineta ricciae]CAF1625679.1 unnamed protein product [Adineta ricciae]
MNVPSIVNRIYIFISCLDFTTAFVFLTLAVVYRHQCFNFPTLLACNTALSILFCSANHVAIGVYMYIWDQYENPNIDTLCSLRAYFHHSSVACIHFSFILLALERYCKVRQLKLLATPWRKTCTVLFQWIVGFTFTLPVLVTGNMPKMASDNLCFVTLLKPDFIVYQSVTTLLTTDVALGILYRSLVRHVRQVSSKLNNNQQTRMHRDLTMVRRIVLLNFQLAIVGIPIIIVVILTLIRVDLIPHKIMRMMLLLSNLPFSPMLIVLLLLTPDLRKSLIKCRNKLKHCRPTKITPIHPIAPISHAQR